MHSARLSLRFQIAADDEHLDLNVKAQIGHAHHARYRVYDA
jgi:hypothetical protein